MNYLLDTCAVSELIKKNPDQNVVCWMSGIDESRLFISVLTIGEIHKGIEKLPEGRKKENLHDWVNSDLTERFNNKILSFDLRAAAVWGKIQARSELSGKTMPIMDGLIAASAISHELTVVTRNISDMEFSGALLINPWDADRHH